MLVVDAQRAGWRGTADEQLQVILTGAIQQVAVQERAAAAGINPDDLFALVTPVPVENVELGLLARVADRGRAERRRACRLRASPGLSVGPDSSLSLSIVGHFGGTIVRGVAVSSGLRCAGRSGSSGRGGQGH